MKALLFTFSLVLAVPITADAYTLCTTAAGNDRRTGSSWWASKNNECPARVSTGQNIFMRIANSSDCVFENQRNRVRMTCKLDISLGEIEDIADAHPYLKQDRRLRSFIERHMYPDGEGDHHHDQELTNVTPANPPSTTQPNATR